MSNISGYQSGQTRGRSNTLAVNFDKCINMSRNSSDPLIDFNLKLASSNIQLDKRGIKKIQEMLRKIAKNPKKESIQKFVQYFDIQMPQENLGGNGSQTSQISVDLNNFSQTEESIHSYLAPVFNSLSAIGSKIYKGKRGDTLLKSITDKLLFETTKNFISDKLQSQNAPSLNTRTSLSYIQFLTSLDPRWTEEFLKNEPGCKLIPNTSDDSNNPVTKFDKFVRNLGEIVHPEFLPGPQGELSSRSGELLTNYGGLESKQIIEDIYSSLTLGEFIRPKNKELTSIPIDKSTYAIFEQEKILADIAENTAYAFGQGGTDNHTNIFGEKIVPEGFKYNPKNKQYISKAGDLYVTTQTYPQLHQSNFQEISIVNAERLGLITPEKAKEFRDDGHTNARLLCIMFRPTTSIRDILTDAKNIANGLPVAMGYADKFVKQALDKIQIINENIGNNEVPLSPIIIGHSMGGLFAQAMGAKYDCPSIGFNPLRLGKGAINFVQEKNIERANSRKRANTHINVVMKGDWVAHPQNPVLGPLLNKLLFVGQTIFVENLQGVEKESTLEQHNDYDCVLKPWAQQRRISRLLAS